MISPVTSTGLNTKAEGKVSHYLEYTGDANIVTCVYLSHKLLVPCYFSSICVRAQGRDGQMRDLKAVNRPRHMGEKLLFTFESYCSGLENDGLVDIVKKNGKIVKSKGEGKAGDD